MCGCAVSPVLLAAIAFPGPSTAPPCAPSHYSPFPGRPRGRPSAAAASGPRPQPAGPAARPREGRRRCRLAALHPAPLTRRPAGLLPRPPPFPALAAPAVSASGGACPLPPPPDRRFLFPPKIHPPSQTTARGQELAPGCRSGHPPCGRGAQSPAGPRPPARPGAAAFAAGSLGVFGGDHSSDLRLSALTQDLVLLPPAPPAPGFGRTATTSRLALDGPGRSPGPVAGRGGGGELGFLIAIEAVNADIFYTV